MIIDVLRLNIGVRRVLQILVDAQFREYEKRISAPRLAVARKAARMYSTGERLSKSTSFRHNDIFFNEKLFSQDGPDGFNYFCLYSCTEDRFFSERTRGGYGVMV